MRTVYTLLLCLCCTAASAQKFMIGLHGGMQFNGAPMGVSDQFDNFSNFTEFAYGGRLGVELRKVQVGVGLLLTEINHSYSTKLSGNLPATTLLGTHYDYSSDILNPYLFVNLVRNMGPLQLYYGLNGGPILLGTGQTQVSWSPMKSYRSTEYVPAQWGISAGLQVGARMRILKGKGPGVFVEGGARYNSAAYEMTQHDLNANMVGTYKGNGFLSFPFLVGVDYRL
ncbi:hypothetical protein [Polluticoccus soli]|uniref:hypothetical protein n=1 Tax=Polluticoccus soli TaxID=3034150 RepID=UPI0023E16DE1|nr:hypothetical protein [Flavipsychrobacter sp. JY13-12]